MTGLEFPALRRLAASNRDLYQLVLAAVEKGDMAALMRAAVAARAAGDGEAAEEILRIPLLIRQHGKNRVVEALRSLARAAAAAGGG